MKQSRFSQVPSAGRRVTMSYKRPSKTRSGDLNAQVMHKITEEDSLESPNKKSASASF